MRDHWIFFALMFLVFWLLLFVFFHRTERRCDSDVRGGFDYCTSSPVRQLALLSTRPPPPTFNIHYAQWFTSELPNTWMSIVFFFSWKLYLKTCWWWYLTGIQLVIFPKMNPVMDLFVHIFLFLQSDWKKKKLTLWSDEAPALFPWKRLSHFDHFWINNVQFILLSAFILESQEALC